MAVQVVTESGLKTWFISHWMTDYLHREYWWHNGTKHMPERGRCDGGTNWFADGTVVSATVGPDPRFGKAAPVAVRLGAAFSAACIYRV
jgi:hypothetical protein